MPELRHLVVNGWFFGQQTNGSGQYLRHLLQHLPHDSVRVTVLLPEPELKGAVSPEQWPGVTFSAAPLTWLPRPLAKLYWEQVTMPLMARRLAADLLWTPYWAAPWWQPCPNVVTIHDLIPLLLPAYRGGLLQRAYTWLVSHTARRAAAVLTISDAAARDIVAHLHVNPARVHAIHHGPNQQGRRLLSTEQRGDVRQRLGLPERFFLYLGGFDVRKNLRGILQAYRLYLDRGGDPAVRLVIAGRLPAADTPFAPDPQKIAADLHLGEQVHFCGWVSEDDKLALYALATAYIFPSLYEGFGMMVLEAMSAGAPVVTSSR